ncbi:MAG: hypothetical protein ACE5JU_23400, partial [Candidatus Binatia bacterium]
MELEGFDPEEPYPQAVLGNRWALLTTLGVSCPKLNALRDLVYEDLDTERLGIGWWKDHLDSRRRILISDYLLQCFDAVHENLLEAQLHLLQLPHFRRSQNRFVAGVVTLRGSGAVGAKLPARTKPADDLPWAMTSLHTTGVVRATASALDCLGGVLVGVIGLKTDIMRTDFRVAVRALQKLSKEPSETRGILTDLQRNLEDAERAAGPTGSVPWVTEYRNLLVHRGRRARKNLLRPTALLFGPSGEPLPRVETVELLPREPDLSEMQMLATVGPTSVLNEDSFETLRGVVASTRQLIEDVSAPLTSFWTTRRANVNQIPQPQEQWKKVGRPTVTVFEGYNPGSVQFDVDTFLTAPEWTTRLKSAALDERQSAVWGIRMEG